MLDVLVRTPAGKVARRGLPIFRGKESEVLTGFGGGDRSLVSREESYWQSGKGDLYGPSVNRTVRCRSASDPECLAVQVLDRGFTDRPAVPDSMLAGRDEIINGLGNPPAGSSPGTCHDFSISIPAIRQEMTCSAGAPFIDQTCLTGWEASGASNETRWACFIAPEMEKTFTCRVPAGFSTTTETHYTCLFDGSALAPERDRVCCFPGLLPRAPDVGNDRHVLGNALRFGGTVLSDGVVRFCFSRRRCGVQIGRMLGVRHIDPLPHLPAGNERRCAAGRRFNQRGSQPPHASRDRQRPDHERDLQGVDQY